MEGITVYNVSTEIALLDARNIEALEDAYEIAERFAAQGHTVEIRDAETDETIKLYNVDDDE